MAYAFSGPRWASPHIIWSFALGNYAKDSNARFSHSLGPTPQNDIRVALATWGGVAGLDFVEVADSLNAGLRFGWGTFGAFGAAGEARWTTSGAPPVFNPDVIIRFEDPGEKPLQYEPFTGAIVYSGTSSALYSVMLHEIGHGLGLAHNSDITSIMYPIAGTTNRALNFDDRFGIQLLYGDFDQNFRATSAPDVFFGFAGTDSVAWNGRFSDFTFGRFVGGGYTVSSNANPFDKDIIFDVESLRFSNARISLASDTGLFDPLFYARANPDVLAAGLDPRQHFDTNGWREGRAPDAVFNPAAYLSANPDVRAAGINPLDHYQSYGWREGRDPSADFDAKLYLARNPDVARAGFEPLTHYLLAGKAEGRAAAPALADHVTGGFDAQHYLLANLDVGRAGVDAYRHWQQNGRFEGRSPDAYFDTLGYLGKYTDVAKAGIDPLAHYMNNGWKEGRDPSAAFDTQKYLATYTDVAKAGLNPLDHFLNFGVYEGRSTFSDGVFS